MKFFLVGSERTLAKRFAAACPKFPDLLIINQ